jgi:LPS export ABC transporter protein LptC
LTVGSEKESLTKMKIFFCFFVLIALVSCENDLDAIKKITFDSTAPDESTKNLTLVYSDSGYAKVEIHAAIAETYRGKEAITIVKDSLRVNFFSEKGDIVSTLSAKYGEINNTRGTILVKDSVRLYNFEKKQTLETEALFWNQNDSSIYSLSQVIIKLPQGIVLGNGIKTNQNFSRYELIKPTGKIKLEKEFQFE